MAEGNSMSEEVKAEDKEGYCDMYRTETAATNFSSTNLTFYCYFFT